MTESDAPIVIVGGGHAAAQLCGLLIEGPTASRVVLVCEESVLPYHRPPLSKAYLKSPAEDVQLHRSASWYADRGIEVHLGDAVVSIDRVAHSVRLKSGAVLPYRKLVLATGTRARTLAVLPAGLDNVASLRDAEDARLLRERLGALQGGGKSVTVLGGGFIGLEVAATARAMGLDVQVLEGAPRLLGRSVSADVAQHILEQHRLAGIDIRLGVKVDGYEVEGPHLASLCVDGVRQPVAFLVLGIGAVPETRLASDAGLEVNDGVVVDASMRTSDADILAVGDCTRFMSREGRALRLESVQNANDQAKIAAAMLLGREEAYCATPWFWSEQGAHRLQMAGLLTESVTAYRRPGATAQSYSVFHYDDGRLVCAESVNAPLDHMMARKLIDAGKHPTPEQVVDTAVPLKSLL